MTDSNHFDLSGELSQAIWRFNFRPDSFIHPSWLDAMPEGEVIKALSGQHPRGEGRVVAHLMQALGLKKSAFFDFSKPLSRLALWRGQELEQLVMYLGAVFHYREIRRVITREDLLKIREVLGDTLWSFMQQRAPRLTHNVDVEIAFPAHMGMKKRFILSGMLCLRAAFVSYPPEFWRRVGYKMERNWFALWRHHAMLGQEMNLLSSECTVLVQKTAIEIKMGMSRDGKILFN